MARTALRRPPARRAADLLAPPSLQLAPGPSTWPRDASVCTAAGLAAFGAAPLLHHPQLATPGLAAGLTAAVARAVHGQRVKARRRLGDRLVEALAPGLGLRVADRRAVRLSRWSRGWPGVPRRVELRYAPGVDDSDPAWRGDLLNAVARRLLADYEVAAHDRRRCRIRLRWTPPPGDVWQVPAIQARAERAVTELLGPTAGVTRAMFDGGQLAAVEGRHAAAAKLAAAGYRARVERVISTILPGRWRASWDLEADTFRFEVRPAFPATIWLPVSDVDAEGDLLSSYDEVQIPYGVDEDGQVMVWRPAHDPNVMNVGAPGTGKPLALDTPVPTPAGWTTMGELTAGDTVFDEHGQPRTVVTAHPVRHDQPCYRMTFSDGGTVVAAAEHLWVTSTRAERASLRRAARPPVDDRWPRRPSEAQLRALRDAAAGAAPASTRPSPAQVNRRRLPVGPGKLYPKRESLAALARWGVSPHRDGTPTPPRSSVRSTAEIAATVRTADGQANHSVPVAAPIDCPTADLPLAPYALGVWLGGGGSGEPAYTSADLEIADHSEAEGIEVVDDVHPAAKPPTCQAREHGMRAPVRRQPDELGLLPGTTPARRARTQRIPPAYLRASIEQRRGLLAGLMDTAGTVSPQGTCQFTTTTEQLAVDVHELACSLGYRATLREQRATLDGKDRGPEWMVAWTISERVFRLERKHLVHQERTAGWLPERLRYITSVEPVESVAVRCITVDSPSRLYLVGRSFVPTHNTVTAHTLLVQTTRHGWPVWVVDGKAIEFLGFQDWPNVQIVATSIEQQVAVIHRAWELMEHRYELITSGRARENDFEPLVVFLDEWADFRGNLMTWYADVKVRGDPTKPPVLAKAASIGRKGRTSRVHLVFGTQRPDAEYFGGDMRDNFRMRISMGRLSPQGAMMMWESPVVGTSIPRGCRGRATTVNDDNRVVEIQTYRTPDPRRTLAGSEEEGLLQRLRPTIVRHERLLILPPAAEPGPDGGQTSPSYGDFAAASWVLAASRPDLDPVAQRRTAAGGGRDLASPMTVFGLAPAATRPLPRPAGSSTPAPTRGDPVGPLSSPPGDADGLDDVEAIEVFDGYGPPLLCVPAKVGVGDLVLIDDSVGLWGVVDADPEEDVADPGCVAVSWRSDDDDAGTLSLPEDLQLTVRHPLDPQE